MKNLFAVCSLLLVLAGCTPDCEYTLIEDGIKPYIFKEGTYWVYSNSATGLNDTFSVIYSSTENVTGSVPHKCKGETTVERNWMTIVHQSDTMGVLSSQEVFVYYGMTEVWLFNPALKNGECTDRKLCKVDDVMLVIGSNTFNNAHKFNTMLYNRIGGVEKHTADIFWVENIGMAKIALQDSLSTTLELQSWHVVQ